MLNVINFKSSTLPILPSFIDFRPKCLKMVNTKVDTEIAW